MDITNDEPSILNMIETQNNTAQEIVNRSVADLNLSLGTDGGSRNSTNKYKRNKDSGSNSQPKQC